MNMPFLLSRFSGFVRHSKASNATGRDNADFCEPMANRQGILFLGCGRIKNRVSKKVEPGPVGYTA